MFKQLDEVEHDIKNLNEEVLTKGMGSEACFHERSLLNKQVVPTNQRRNILEAEI